MHKVTVADKISLDMLHKGGILSEKEAFQGSHYETITHNGRRTPRRKANWRGAYVCRQYQLAPQQGVFWPETSKGQQPQCLCDQCLASVVCSFAGFAKQEDS